MKQAGFRKRTFGDEQKLSTDERNEPPDQIKALAQRNGEPGYRKRKLDDQQRQTALSKRESGQLGLMAGIE
jgi:hypothetical protein